jgi:ABC-2 type transport system permease protein
MVRAFRSELTKLQRWSVFVGGATMVAFTAAIAFFAITQIAGGARGMFLPMIQLLKTDQGLTTVVGSPGQFVIAIAIIIVTANVAMEWSQGTLRNLLVREPGRLRWLAGKMLALLLFVTISAALAMLAGAGVALAAAQSHGISTASWTSAQGVRTFLSFFGNGLLGIIGVSLLGMFIAVLTRSAAAGVGISLVYVLVGEALINQVWPQGAQWLPVHLFNYLTSAFGYGAPPMGYGSALVVALLWMICFVVAGAAVFRLRDISA